MAYARSFAPLTSVAVDNGHHRVGRELVVLDSGVFSPEVQLGGLSRPAEILVLDSSCPVLPQFTAALAACRPVSALHVIAHGRPGAVRLGGEELTAAGLDGVSAWRASLAPGATIALHACQAGAGEPGRALIEGLAAATGARVAASREDIGAGLPWRLDATSDGLGIAPIVGAAAQAAYPHRLPTSLVSGTETLVNTTTNNDQYQPTVTALSDGGYVVIWKSPNGLDLSVYAQRYDAAGATVGGETLINTIPVKMTNAFYEQESPTVTGLSDGGYAMTWMAPDSSGWGIYTQRYDGAGAAVGGRNTGKHHHGQRPNLSHNDGPVGRRLRGYLDVLRSGRL